MHSTTNHNPKYSPASVPGGRLRTETNTEGLATYGYDAANQLTSVTRPAGQTNESYSYDSGGNRTMTGYTTGVGNELLASPGATYAYDAEGNLTAKTETTTGNVWSYTYDIRNRMTGVTEKNSGGTVIYQASYTYDALDRRIATTVNGTTTWTVYDGQNTYADFSGAGTLKTRYLYGPAIDELFARTDSSGTTAWYLTDRLGSVRDLASTSGGLLDHLAYDAYGNIVSESQPSNGDRFKWTAREWDGTTRLQFNRHRYYAPGVGRWTQLDPIRSVSLYTDALYASNAPLNARDPSGAIPLPIVVGIIGGAIGGKITGGWGSAFIGAITGAYGGLTLVTIGGHLVWRSTVAGLADSASNLLLGSLLTGTKNDFNTIVVTIGVGTVLGTVGGLIGSRIDNVITDAGISTYVSIFSACSQFFAQALSNAAQDLDKKIIAGTRISKI